jgi:hypothetical protein
LRAAARPVSHCINAVSIGRLIQKVHQPLLDLSSLLYMLTYPTVLPEKYLLNKFASKY